MVQLVSSMRGASAESLAALVDRLDGVTDGADPAAELAGDLFGLAAVLRSEPALRRVATDLSTSGEAKAGLIRSLLQGKVGAAALDLAADAVTRRWAATRDLADAFEHLGVIASVRSAGRDRAERLADELFAVGQIVDENADLRIALSDPTRSAVDKRGLLRRLLEGKALPATITLVEQALSGSHRSVGVAIAVYQRVAAAVYDESVARVRVARDLSTADRTRLQESLSRQYGRPVHLNVSVDPELLGGMRVEIGDDVIDGTVAARLDAARRKLAG